MMRALLLDVPSMLRRARVLAFASLAAVPAAEAQAYCISGACPDGAEQFCDMGTDMPPSCHPIRWKNGCTGFTIQRDGGPELAPDELETYARAAFDHWQEVDCGGGAIPGVFSVSMGTVPCNKVEYNKDGGNQNVIVVRAVAWPHPPSAGHDIALTTTTFDPETGELLDADMELNAVNFHLTTSDTMVDFDLASVLQHETGHFLGMAHSLDDSATMRPFYDEGATDLRSLEPDDAAGICALYPPDDSVTADCDPLGRHGFSPDCRASQIEGTCATAPGDKDPSPIYAAFGVAALALVRARSASRRR